MMESTLVLLAIFVAALVILDLAAMRWGVDSRPIGPFRWI
jgi:hypothetical protein